MLLPPVILAALLAAPPAHPAPDLRLLVGGRTGGVSAHYTRMLAPEILASKPDPLVVRRVGYAAFERRGCILFSQQPLELSELRERVGDPTRRRTAVTDVVAARSILDLSWDDAGGVMVDRILERAPAIPGGHAFQKQAERLVRWQGEQGELWGLESATCTPGDAAVADPLDWEVRSVTEMQGVLPGGRAVRSWSIAHPLGEGTRRHVAAQQAAHYSQEDGTRYVELLAGEDMEAASYVDRAASPQRRVTEQALAERRPAVWVPQAAELYEGLESFRALCTRVGSVPTSANLQRADGQLALPAYAWVKDGERRVLVIGVTSLQEAGSLPAPVARTLRLAPARPAVEKALDKAVAELGRWPDLVVLLGVLEGPTAAELTEVPGVDITYVRFEKAYANVVQQATFPAASERATRPAVLLVRPSPWRMETTEVWWPSAGNEGTTRVEHVATALSVDLPRDDELSYQVQAGRQPVYEAGSRTLLGDVAPLIEGPQARPAVASVAASDPERPPRLGRALYGNLTAAILQDATTADVAITPPPREFWRAPGGFSVLRVEAALAGTDGLVVVLLSGAELEKTLASARALGLGVAGEVEKQVGGRPLDPRERYLVATTEGLAVQLGIESQVRSRRFVAVGPRLVPVLLGGEPVLYRQVVLKRLERLRQRHAAGGEFGEDYLAAVARLLVPRGREVSSRLVLEARDVTVSMSLNQVRGAQAYPDVPDTRVRTPSNTSILLTGMARAALETPWVALELRGAARWDRRIYARSEDLTSPFRTGNDVKDAFNTWSLTAELRQPALAWSIPSWRLRMEPYTAVSYESQFGRLPTELDRKQLPPVALGRAATGAAVFSGVFLKELRLGLVAQQDFQQPLYASTGWRSPGMSVGLESSMSGGYEWGRVALDVTGMWRWLAPRPDVDSPRDLALTAGLRAAIKARIMEGISVSAFGDAYGFQGKLEGDQPGASFVAGLGVAADRRWKPFTELGFFW